MRVCGMEMFKKLVSQFNIKSKKAANQGMINPIEHCNTLKNEFLDGLSLKALKIYEKEQDIKNFSKLVLSDLADNTDEARLKELFESGVTDPFEDEKLAQLADNEKFLRDLGLTE